MKTITHPTLTGESGATFSDCGVYRYSLWRRWGPGEKALVFIGLNPSTADAMIDDPTIRRCIGFARREDCDLLVMLNLFALRSTDPAGLMRDPEPIGRDNDSTIWQWRSLYPDSAVAAWGNYKLAKERADTIFDPQSTYTRDLLCLGVNKDGSPRHPLYLPRGAKLLNWQWCQQQMKALSK